MTTTETITAQATPPGRGGVGIIRISGPLSPKVAQTLLGKLPSPRQAEFLDFKDAKGETIDQGLAIYFPAPHSFTGEEVLELHGHGGPVVMDMLLRTITSQGVRLARPGEFSERAFLNDKLDLAQAEAIADLIAASSEQAAHSAMQSLRGVFSDAIHALMEALSELRMFVEASLDFPEEDINFLAEHNVADKVQTLHADISRILEIAQQGCLLHEGVRVVLAGQPNTGKSSLLNALAKRESAIVTHIPGTTRDVLREEIHIDGLPIHIIDTAGLRQSSDVVEQAGMDRTRKELQQASCVLIVIDDRKGITQEDRDILQSMSASIPVTFVRNKIDLTHNTPAIITSEHGTEISLSATQGTGLDLLREHLKTSVGYTHVGEGMFMARRRHLDALQRALICLQAAQAQLTQHEAGELLAEELRQAQRALGEITGEVTSDELLGRIFASFCIGK